MQISKGETGDCTLNFAGMRKRILRSAVCVAVTATLFPVIVQAESDDVSGELNTGGKLIQYFAYRPHVSAGAPLRIYDNAGRYSRFGLRDEYDNRVVRSNQYNVSGGDKDFAMHTGSKTIPSGSYALTDVWDRECWQTNFGKGF